MSNAKTIAKNTGWFGLENAISAFLTIFTSIAIARTLGPTKMGYIVYVTWIASAVADLAGLGIPSTTRKYMAEYLGMGDRGTARYIYRHTFMLQACLATFATCGLLIWVLRDASPEYKIAATLIVISIWPSMVNATSSQANIAMENLSRNLPGSAVSIIVFALMIVATVTLHWGVTGVGASVLGMRLVDFLVRIFPTVREINRWDRAHSFSDVLRDRMLRFAWQSVALMVVGMIVWQRSEFILLKHLCKDIRQVAFYSVAFSMAERLLITSSIFGLASGTTVFVQYGRDKSKIPNITASTFRYLALTSIPLHFIAAALAAPALLLLYGNQYTGAFAVVTIAPLLCMPKAFNGPATSLLQVYEGQKLVIAATLTAGIVDIAVAWLLIPAYGAVGACIGSGAAETTAVGLMWAFSIYLYKVRLPWALVAKVISISACAALTARFIALMLPPIWGILIGGSIALAVVFGLFYLLRVLEPEDSARFITLSNSLPMRFRGITNRLLAVLVRPSSTTLIAAENVTLGGPK